METEAPFSADDLDAVSDIPTLHLSAVIHTLLPIRLIEWKTVKRHFESAADGIKASLSDNMKENFDFLVTGSTAEGYCLPLVATRTSPTRMEVLSDVDILFVNRLISVSIKGVEQQNNDASVYLDCEKVKPGYARLCLPHIKKEDEASVFVKEEGKYYLSSTRYITKMFSTQDKWNLDETTDVKVQGPAITLENHQVLTEENINKSDAGISKDLVIALPCSQWPEIANGIKDRAAKSQWLQSALVESIINDGCHVVAIPSKNSMYPDLEWRLSFSASEGRLAREAVTDHQRQCYIFLKILRFQVMKSQSILSSYVFKCIFLYSCEQLPVNDWKKCPGSCLLYMLGKLLECLHEKHVPTYFVPENNLVGHMSDDEIKDAISAVEKMRLDSVTPVLDFMDDKMFVCHCSILNFRSVIKPVLDDIEEYKQHRNSAQSINNGVYSTYCIMCTSLLHEESLYKEVERMNHREAVRYILDLYTVWIGPLQYFESMLQFVNSFGLSLKNSKLSLRFFDSLLSLSTEYPEFLTVRGNLACMYHSAAYIHEDGSTQRCKYLKKAGEMFKQIYDETKGSAIDYITYLVKQKKLKFAKEILEDILEDESKIANTGYSYDFNELETLDHPLKEYVQENGKIAGDTVSFAYFYMVKCLCVEEHTPRRLSATNDLLNKFQLYCQKMKKDHLFNLLQVAKALAQTHEVATKQSSKQSILSSTTKCLLLFTVTATVLTILVRTLKSR